LQMLTPEGHRNVGHAHGRARVTRVGLLNGVHCQRTDCVGHLWVLGHGVKKLGVRGGFSEASDFSGARPRQTDPLSSGYT
jgi:hypothetical protein